MRRSTWPSTPWSLWFPAATRSDTGTAVIPALIFHTKKALPVDRTFYFLPHRLEMHYLPPVEVGDLDAETLKEKVYGIMTDYYLEHKS